MVFKISHARQIGVHCLLRRNLASDDLRGRQDCSGQAIPVHFFKNERRWIYSSLLPEASATLLP